MRSADRVKCGAADAAVQLGNRNLSKNESRQGRPEREIGDAGWLLMGTK
jgi:hypothetical protein